MTDKTSISLRFFYAYIFSKLLPNCFVYACMHVLYVRIYVYKNIKNAYKRKYLILCIQDRFIKYLSLICIFTVLSALVPEFYEMNLQSHISNAMACYIFHSIKSTVAEFTLEPYANSCKKKKRGDEREIGRLCPKLTCKNESIGHLGFRILIGNPRQKIAGGRIEITS